MDRKPCPENLTDYWGPYKIPVYELLSNYFLSIFIHASAHDPGELGPDLMPMGRRQL